MVTKNKITIKAPTKKTIKDAAQELRRGHSAGGRVEAERKIAIKNASKRKTSKR